MKKLSTRISLIIITILSPYYALAIGIGDTLPADAKESGYLLMIAPAQMNDAYSVEEDGYIYLVTTDKFSLINYIFIDDESFTTPEGIGVGDSYEKVRKLSTKALMREPGGAFYVELPSGWNAAFVQGESMTEGELSSESQVLWLFRRGPIY
jgi:hypothetical protein